jgi:hypothetical protein
MISPNQRNETFWEVLETGIKTYDHTTVAHYVSSCGKAVPLHDREVL